MRVLLVTPPLVQLNTPYPATTYLAGFLRANAAHLNLHVAQADAGLELFLRVFCRAGISAVASALEQAVHAKTVPSAAVAYFQEYAESYIAAVEPAVRFLQGKDPSMALRIAGRAFLPEGPRFAVLRDAPEDADPLSWAFGPLGIQDQAKYIASLFIDDLADVIRDGIDPHFELSRYGERLAVSAPSFDPLAQALAQSNTLLDSHLDAIAADLNAAHSPEVVGLTAPFPGNVYGAFRLAQAFRRLRPGIITVLGGGYVNTELRDLSEPRVFDCFDFVTLDDGEQPLLSLLQHLQDKTKPLFRTFVREAGHVVLKTDSTKHDIPQRDTGTPTYGNLPLDRYVSLLEMPNPMHRMWSDLRWNKLTVAHGCYWKKCTFCDVSLDYIGRYEAAPTQLLLGNIEALIAETGQTGFHFVDEAAPPAKLESLAEGLLSRGLQITWWTNIRFEKTFTPDLAMKLAQSGCVALTGGLEVASNRLLSLMKKGVTVEQVARVTRALTDAGIMVHAYLMYGFPTETAQETIDALERVRQLFAEGCLQSAYWHRFAATVHSPIGLAPDTYGIRLRPLAKTAFARNEVGFDDPVGTDHDALGVGLRKALYNFMHGTGLEEDVRSWFEGGRRAIPKTTVPTDLIRRAIE